jgi:hypothetical protein
MKGIAGAIVLLAGAILAGLGVLAEAVQRLRPKEPDLPLDVSLVQITGVVVGIIGFVLVVTEVTKGEGDESGPPAEPKSDGAP